jgi:transcriptional regulator with XRE-family HTH domain
MEDINKIFGQRLKKLRESRGLFQEDIGEWFSMGKSTVSQWESGRLPHATIIAKLAVKFKVSSDYLLGLDDNLQKSSLTIAAHRTDDPTSDLPPEAEERVQEFIELMRMKYGKK